MPLIYRRVHFTHHAPAMPIPLASDAPSLLILKSAFERAGLARADIDAWLNLTADEFRVEGELIVVGPVYDTEALQALVAGLEDRGLAFYDDFFELSGNWPAWVQLLAMAPRR